MKSFTIKRPKSITHDQVTPEVIAIAVQLEFAGYDDDRVMRDFGFSTVMEFSQFIHNKKLYPTVLRESTDRDDKTNSIPASVGELFNRFYFGIANALFTLIIFFTLWLSPFRNGLRPVDSLVIVVLSHIFASGWVRIISLTASNAYRYFAHHLQYVVMPFYWRGLMGILCGGVAFIGLAYLFPSSYLFQHLILFLMTFINVSMLWLHIGYFAGLREIHTPVFLFGVILFVMGVLSRGIGNISVNADPLLILGFFNFLSVVVITARLLHYRLKSKNIKHLASVQQELLPHSSGAFVFGIGYGIMLLVDLGVLGIMGSFHDYESLVNGFLAQKYLGIAPILVSAGLIEVLSFTFFKKITQLEAREYNALSLQRALVRSYKQTIRNFFVLHVFLMAMFVFSLIGLLYLVPGHFVLALDLIFVISSLGMMFCLFGLFNTTILHYLGVTTTHTIILLVSIVVGFLGGVVLVQLFGTIYAAGGFLINSVLFFLLTAYKALKRFDRFSYYAYAQSIKN